VEKIYPNKQKQTLLPSVRCPHSFHRRGCSISQRGSKGAGRLCIWRKKPGPQNMGSPKTRHRCQREPWWSQTEGQGFRPSCHWNSIPWRLCHLCCLY